jgi:hypothetical protein
MLAVVAACGGSGSGSAGGSGASTAPTSAPSGKCLVRLHGKGETGAPTTKAGDVTVIAPTGNADGWGAKQWLYFPADRYEAARAVVATSATGCEQIILHGFSNGGSFAAALYCKGETFDGRLVRVVVDDPVTDHAADSCTPASGVAVTLYATGALEKTATPGWKCASADWTCEGGETIGIDAYAAKLGVPVQKSPFSDHQPFLDAPELQWR